MPVHLLVHRCRTGVGHVTSRMLYAGLDSTTAMNLVTSLCQLAAGGRAVITTIHQPSSRLYQQLDKLLLLSDGHCMYYGACLSHPSRTCSRFL